MHRVLLEHPYIGSYRAFLLVALASGWILARGRAKKCKIDPRHIDNVLLLVALTGLAGGRFFSRLFYFPTPLTFWQALKVWEEGGLVFYGGVVFGLLTVLIYCAARRLSFFSILDVLAPSLALGLGFGRIGCFLVGCCWGDVCVDPALLKNVSPSVREQIQTLPALSSKTFPLAVQFPAEAGALEQHQALGLISADAKHSLPVHPVQLYEAALAFILCGYLNAAFKRKRVDGEIFFRFAFIYGWVRFGLELLRADSAPVYFHGATISQCISAAFIFGSLLIFYFSRKKLRHAFS